MIKAILLDLDGTLINSLPLYVKSYDKALKNQGFNFSDKKIAETCFNKTEEVVCAKLGIPKKTEEFRNDYFSEAKNHFQKAKLFPQVTECLHLAKKKQIKLAIISFAYNWYVKTMVKRLKLNKYFSTIIGFNDVKKAKPDPEAAVLACKKLNVSPEETIVIGDSRNDIIMGKRAGCKTVLFYPKVHELFYDLKVLKESNPDKIISNFKKLKEIIVNFCLENRSCPLTD